MVISSDYQRVSKIVPRVVLPTCEKLAFRPMLETLQIRSNTAANKKTARFLPRRSKLGADGCAQPLMMISVARGSGIAIGISRSAMKNLSSFFDKESGSTRT